MGSTGALAGIVVALIGIGCGGASSGDRAAAFPDRDAEESWGTAWDRLMTGDEEVVQSGGIALEKTGDGAIKAWRVSGDAGGEAEAPGEEATDVAVLSAVKTRLAADVDTEALDIDVDVDERVVTLAGEVDTPYEAREAMRIALDTSGVDQVVSRLRWQGSLPAM